MKRDLIFEIGTEELPPSCIGEGTAGLKDVVGNKLAENRLEFTDIRTYSSPRRLVAVVEGLEEVQKTKIQTVTGPLLKVAFDKDGNPNGAARGFARSLNVKVSDLEEIKIEGKGIYVGKKIKRQGKKTVDILPRILRESILTMTFSKQMTWADYNIKFMRPIRWILALYGGKIIKFNLENLRSGNITFGHRTLSPGPITIKEAGSYFKLLEDKGTVIVDEGRRKKFILDQIAELEQKVWKGHCKVVLNEDLLDDVVSLVEIPNVIVGNFPEKFLYIPKELLIEAIQHHQRYFAVLGKSGKVSTKFIIVQNGIKDNGGIKKGNERVLKARLSDAAFFYKQDRKHDFNYWLDKLKGVIFFSNLGSIYDKAVRLKKISMHIAGLLVKSKTLPEDDISGSLAKASMLCKCDLVTNMVVEFPALQGIVGRQYARESGEDRKVSDAVFEHYLPRSAGDILPRTDAGAILSMADKIDTITGMFLAGKIPSGSADPFALRRKASGIVLTILERGYDFSLDGLINYNQQLYIESFNLKGADDSDINLKIKDFIITRYRFLLEKKGKRLDILESVLGSGCSSISDIDLRYKAVDKFMAEQDIKKISLPMIRCKNIVNGKECGKVDAGLFKGKYEKELFSHTSKKETIIKNLILKKDHNAVLTELKTFGEVVDLFFDKVLVMDEDKTIRANRINLVKRAADIYLMLADFSKIIIEGSNKT